MKKFFFLAIAATSLLASCSSTSGLISKAKKMNFKESKPIIVTDVIADLEVSPKKISFLYIPSKSVNKAGYDNVVETAVREALIANGNADVFVDLDKQIKVQDDGEVESITISGYPAKYVNFRSINEEYIKKLGKDFMELDMRVDTTLQTISPYLNISSGSSNSNGGGISKSFIGKFK